MKNLKHGLLTLTLGVTLSVLACTPEGNEGFVPENNLKISAHEHRLGGLSEAQYNEAIDRVEVVYAPIVASMGAKLIIMRDWEDPRVNAYAERLHDNWRVRTFGGLARHEAVTEDAMSLVVCHEVGHHIGGAPRKIGPYASPWASNEGQADYFATLKCLRKVWLNDNNLEIISQMNVPKALAEACAKKEASEADSALCVRGGMAGMSVAKLFQATAQAPIDPKFDTPDASIVSVMNDKHPAYQCRLDTFFQGALCDVSMNEDVSEISEVTGTCHSSLGYSVGLRPLCWFKPSVQ